MQRPPPLVGAHALYVRRRKTLMKTCLFIATLYSLFSALACIATGLSWIFLPSGIFNANAWGTMLLLFGTPPSIALAIVFNFVRERLDDVRHGVANDRTPETAGTPWESDPDHTAVK